MSLFKTRDWWSNPEESKLVEECDSGHLAVGNITNDDPPVNKVISGGFSGRLEIYAPQTYYNEEEEKEIFGYRPDHLVLETNLGLPILQLEIGKFVSGNSALHLCVLHQESFVVYSVIAIKGQTGHGSQTKLSKVYQHNFQRKAYSITTGNFGSVKGKDFVAVQSLDGCISFYEQESLGFVCFLPGFLLPGPLAYLPKSDTLVTIGSDWTLQSYKYQTLSVLDQDSKNASNLKFGGKRIQPEWSQIMSEAALDLKVLIEPGNISSVLVLMLHSFMCFKDTGVAKFVKKLEYNPSCFTAYYHEKSIFICVASHTHNLLVYKENELKWASQLSFIPVSMKRCDFKGLKAGLVFLGENGQVQVCYLGTDPSLFVAPPHETREINYEQTDREMSKLNEIIRDSTRDSGSIMSLSKGERELVVSASVSSKLDAWVGPTKVNDPDGIPCVSVIIKLTPHGTLKTVRVNINVEKPISVTQDTFVMNNVCDNCQIVVKFYLADQYVPSSLNATIVTSYISVSGAPYVIKTEIKLPLKLVAKPNAPNKEADHKVTISTNKPAVSLPDLFTEYSLDSGMAMALGLQYYGGATVTVLSSRTSSRYRLQSDSLPSIWVIFEVMKSRLEKYWSIEGKGSDEKLCLTLTSPLPTQELLSEIDAHFLRRKKHKELESQLVQRAAQFRAVQRRLLTKFKDKTPSPLINFDNLLEGTYKQILQITEVINNNISGLEEDGCQLSCILKLLVELLCMTAGLGELQKELLLATLSPVFYQNMDQGWEETIDNSVTFVLRSFLARGNRDMVVSNQTLIFPTDTNKLKKHIGLLVDRVVKGGFNADSDFKNNQDAKKGVESPQEGGDDNLSENEDSLLDDAIFPSQDNTEVPLGSRLGEDRARSARLRSARLQKSSKRISFAPRDEIEGEGGESTHGASSPPSEEASTNEGKDQESSAHDPESNPVYEEISEDDNNKEEPIYANINDPNEREETDDKSESLKRATTSSKDRLIDAPSDIFGNPIEDDKW